MIIVGIDPGTGASSPTGFAAIDPIDKRIIWICDVRSQRTKLEHRIKDISLRVDTLLWSLDPSVWSKVYCESFVMRGKGGETLSRLTGALMSVVPDHMDFDFVQNTTVKKLVAGHGGGNKEDVAYGVKKFFGFDSEEAAQVQQLIDGKKWDQVDALAIAIAGYKRDYAD